MSPFPLYADSVDCVVSNTELCTLLMTLSGSSYSTSNFFNLA